MQNVFLLTEHGNLYTREGIKFLRRKIRKSRRQTDRLCFKMGYSLNNTEFLAKHLEDDSIVVLSTEDRVYFIFYEAFDDFKDMLRNSGERTSWEVAKQFCDEEESATNSS